MNAYTSPVSLPARLLLLVTLCACKEQPPVEKVLRPVRAEIPDASACSVASRFSGNIEPLTRVDLAFKRGGYVGTIMQVRGTEGQRILDQGDVVRRGAVLARLRDSDYRAKLEQAKAQLSHARAARDQARQDSERAKVLLAGEVVSSAVAEGAEAKALVAEAQVQAAKAFITEAELAIKDCVLRAPADAVLWKRLVEVGSLVGPGTPGFILADTTSMKVVFGVPDVLLDRVRVGAKLSVSIEALDQLNVNGRVASVAPMADPKTRLFGVDIILPNSDGRLRAGMIASLRMLQQDSRPALAVPLSALVRPPGSAEGFAVFVASGDVLHVRRIEPGEICAGNVEVSSGLRPDDRVVIEGAAQAFDGERVTLVR